MTLLIIRNAQMAVLREAMLRQFAAQSASRMKARFPEVVATMTEDTVFDRVFSTAQRARTHGITRRHDIEQFLEFEFLYGPEFEKLHSEAGLILARREIDGARKMALIEDWELFGRPERSHR